MKSRFNISYGSTPVGQFEIAGAGHDLAGLARKRAAEPIKPSKPQEPCDIGLFSDESSQLDLVEMFMEPENDDV